MVYYAGHPVQCCDTPEQLQQFLEQAPHAYVITLDKYEKEIERKQPGQFRVLARERRFLANDEMVVLAPSARIDHSHTANRPPYSYPLYPFCQCSGVGTGTLDVPRCSAIIGLY
jgi:hypothetical protein